jgi:hypothetical protein
MAYNSLIATNLRLPRAGQRVWSGGIYMYQSQIGYYWSSTPTTSSSNSDYLEYNISNIKAIHNTDRSTGLNVRCLKN